MSTMTTGRDDDVGYGIGAVSRRLGVPAPTLRTWNLRYGIGPSRRSPGGHRRYDTADLRRLEEMNRLIHTGVPPAEAAGRALRLAAALLPAPAVPGVEERPFEPVLSAARLVRAALVLDSETVGQSLDAALRRHGVVWTWERLVLPVFAAISARQADTGSGIDTEHAFSDLLMVALASHPAPAGPAARPVLLACAEDEQHSLPVRALAAALAERRVRTRVVGARTPYSALADAMRRTAPAVVFVWSQQSETGDPAPLAALPRLRPAGLVVVGGPGWWEALPPGVIRVHTFGQALTRILSALG